MLLLHLRFYAPSGHLLLLAPSRIPEICPLSATGRGAVFVRTHGIPSRGDGRSQCTLNSCTLRQSVRHYMIVYILLPQHMPLW
jgi:hypothetical protein